MLIAVLSIIEHTEVIYTKTSYCNFLYSE